MANAMHLIDPYRDLQSGLWVFDDPARGLEREPFVPVTGVVIDALLAHKHIEGDRFSLLFSDGAFPDAHIELTRIDETSEPLPLTTGSWYEAKIVGLKGRLELWLCPALLKYFPDGPPPQLFASVLPPDQDDEPDVEILEAE